MFRVGQVVHTKRGSGVISGLGDSTRYVYVRLNAGLDEIYVMDRSDLMAEEAEVAGYSASPPIEAASLSEATGRGPDSEKQEGQSSRRVSRRSTKGRRTSLPTPIARFVNSRLEELGLKQCDFCRKTGFDQGLLSRIQSSTSSNLSLESCLRLAIGCSVSPEKIFELIGRPDFHSLIAGCYSTSTHGAGNGADRTDLD